MIAKKIYGAVIRHGIGAVSVASAMKLYALGDLPHAIAAGAGALFALLASIAEKAEEGKRLVATLSQTLEPRRAEGLHRIENERPLPPVPPAREVVERAAGPAMPVSGTALAVLLSLMFTGCATGNKAVPGNHIKGSIAGQPFEIQNPKNTLMEGVVLSHTSGTNTFNLTIAKIASTNDPQVIDKSYAGQAHVTEKMFQGMTQMAEQFNRMLEKISEGTARGMNPAGGLGSLQTATPNSRAPIANSQAGAGNQSPIPLEQRFSTTLAN